MLGQSIIVLIYGIICGFICVKLTPKGKNQLLPFLLGFFFGVFGILIYVLLEKTKPGQKSAEIKNTQSDKEGIKS